MAGMARVCGLLLLLLQWHVAGTAQQTARLKQAHLRSVRFIDQSVGWVAGCGGVFSTRDGGRTWHREQGSLGLIYPKTPPDATVVAEAYECGSIVWADRDNVVVRGDKTLVQVSLRSGNWRELPPWTISHQVADVQFLDEMHGWATGWNWAVGGASVYGTADGGASWALLNGRASEHILGAILPVSTTELWAVGQEGAVIHSRDGGSTWSRLQELGGDLLAIRFTTGATGWLCGVSSIFRTDDGGQTWHRQTAPVRTGFRALSFTDEKEGWIVGEQYREGGKLMDAVILHTVDGGAHWELQTSGVHDDLLDVQALPEGRALAVAADGSLIRTENHGRQWVRVDAR